MLSAMVSTLVAVFEAHRTASCLVTLAVAVEFFGDRLDAAPLMAAVLTSVCNSAAPIFKVCHSAAPRAFDLSTCVGTDSRLFMHSAHVLTYAVHSAHRLAHTLSVHLMCPSEATEWILPTPQHGRDPLPGLDMTTA